MSDADFALTFKGKDAEDNRIEFYDAARALIGFERSLAITIHAVLNGTVIVQAPALKGARIYISPPEPGSWTTRAAVVVGALWALNNAPKESPIGHLIYSAYDYVVSQSLGFHVDYSKTIGQQIDEGTIIPPSKKFNEGLLDGVIERYQPSIEDMHRPIIFSQSAGKASITNFKFGTKIGPELDVGTYAFISETTERPKEQNFLGTISSYNINSFTGRIYIPELSRTVRFELGEHARSNSVVTKIMQSISANALKDDNKFVIIFARVYESRTGVIKKLLINNVIANVNLGISQ